jgi:predicted DNA-binding WGR domain protein
MGKILPGSVTYLENRSSRHAFYLVYVVELGAYAYDAVRQWGRIGTAGQSQSKRWTTAASARSDCAGLVQAKISRGYNAPGGIPSQIMAALRRVDPSYGLGPAATAPQAASIAPKGKVSRADVRAAARYVVVPTRFAVGPHRLYEISLTEAGKAHVLGAPGGLASAIGTMVSAVFRPGLVDDVVRVVVLAGDAVPGQVAVEIHDLVTFHGTKVLDRRFAERHAMLREVIDNLRAEQALPVKASLAELVSGPERERAMAGGDCFVRDLTATGDAGWHTLGD